MAGRRPEVGSIVEIELPTGRFAYGRVLHDGALAVYRGTSDAPGNPPDPNSGHRFVVGIYEPDLRSLPVVAMSTFLSEEESWPPPFSVRDPITGGYSIYKRGSISPVSGDIDPSSLEPAAAWSIEQIRRRITDLG